jgi:hypothetical protein
VGWRDTSKGQPYAANGYIMGRNGAIDERAGL